MNQTSTTAITYPDRPRLLVVDDQPIHIRALREIFREDHEVFMATSGEQALEVCAQSSPDLILLDVQMPELDGLAVCQRLKDNPETSNIPVIFVTAQDEVADETRGFAAGAVDFISKPFNPDVVRARVRTHVMLKLQSDFLQSLAFMDGLTGVANRRHFDERLEAEWRACMRSRQPLSVILLDVDHFKKYNDHYGHQQGDDCLVQAAAVFREQAHRPHDLVARYGGEEFVCLLPATESDGAKRIAEQFRAGLEALQIPHEQSTTADVVTISAGVATVIPDQESDAASLVALADEQLYKAKELGRNRVVAA